MGSNASVSRKARPLEDAKAGRNYCLWLLGRREYSRAELLKKLTQRALEHAIAEEVVQRLVDEGLQSDQRCIEAVQRSAAARGWSRRRMEQKLRTQGIDPSEALDHDLLSAENEAERSRALFDQWMAKTDGSYPAKRKVLARLARRGFPVGHLF